MHVEWTWQTPASSETLRLPLLGAQTTANPWVHFRKSSDACGLGLNSSFSTDWVWLNSPYLLGLCACPSRVSSLSWQTGWWFLLHLLKQRLNEIFWNRVLSTAWSEVNTHTHRSSSDFFTADSCLLIQETRLLILCSLALLKVRSLKLVSLGLNQDTSRALSLWGSREESVSFPFPASGGSLHALSHGLIPHL